LYNSSKRLFLEENNSPKKSGTRMVNEDFAFTLELIARDGISAFYSGPIAVDIVKAIREDPINPGNLTLDDLQNYKAVFRKPVRYSYKGRNFLYKFFNI